MALPTARGSLLRLAGVTLLIVGAAYGRRGAVALPLRNAPFAIDLYAAVMPHWRPGKAWFQANTPRLASVVGPLAEVARLAPIMVQHFPG